jgi:hypothetical protein
MSTRRPRDQGTLSLRDTPRTWVGTQSSWGHVHLHRLHLPKAAPDYACTNYTEEDMPYRKIIKVYFCVISHLFIILYVML